MNSGRGSNRYSLFHNRVPSAVDPGVRSAIAFGVSYSCSRLESHGMTCRRRSLGVAVSLVGEGSEHGSAPVCFAGYSRSYSMSSACEGRSIGAGWRSTPAACEPSKGDQYGPEPDGPRQIGLETPSYRRSKGPPSDRAAFCGERSRQARSVASVRRHRAGPRTARTTPSAASQGTWRQGLRLPRHTARSAPASYHPADCSPRHRVERATWTTSMGRRAHSGVAPSIQATSDPRRATWGSPLGAAGTGLLPDPLSRPHEGFLKRPLKHEPPSVRGATVPQVQAGSQQAIGTTTKVLWGGEHMGLMSVRPQIALPSGIACKP